MAEHRHFTHLSQVEIRDIVSSYYEGETKYKIAQRLGIDKQAVTYQIRKYEKSSPEVSSNVYTVIKTGFRRTCGHPSLKCFLCGTHQDNLRNEDRATILDLT